MKIPKSDKPFESCPPFEGRAVCVDVTPLEKRETKFGLKNQFKLVFEVDKAKPSDGAPYAVWSKWMVPSSHEKAALRLLLKDWYGRDLTEAEWSAFDTEELIGRPARIIVINEREGEDVYANIKLLLPHRPQDGEPLKPSGKFVRKQDRENGNGSYHKTEQSDDDPAIADWLKTKVHCGRHAGHELRELSEEAIVALIEHWQPTALAKGTKATADDKRLLAALAKYWEQKEVNDAAAAEVAADKAADDCPY